MAENIKVVGVVPSLNPDPKLVDVVKGLLEVGISNVLVIDDGSKEECLCFFNEVEKLEGCTVLHHEVNKGKGRAIKTAIEYYQKNFDLNEYKGIVTLDADGQHLSKDVYNCAVKLMENPNSLILGTRDFDDENVPFKSRRGNKLTSMFFKLLYGVRVHDVMTGLRAIPNKICNEGLEIASDRFEWETKMLIMAVNQRESVIEVIIETVYFDNNRETTFHPVKDSIRIYKILFGTFFKFLFSALICIIVDQGLFALFQKVIFKNLKIGNAIFAATALARLISSFVNYLLNRNVVFENKGKSNKSVVRYYILCVCQMGVSALGVWGINKLTDIDPSIVKIIVDTLLFFVSYHVQRIWVFKKDASKENR